MKEQEREGRQEKVFWVKPGRIHDFEKTILQRGICHWLILQDFYRTEDGEWCRYCDETYLPLAKHLEQERRNGTTAGKRILELLKEIIEDLLQGEDHLLRAERYSLRPETFYWDPESKGVKILFLEEEEPEEEAVRSRLADLTEQLGRRCGDLFWQRYLDRFLLELRSGKGGLRSVLRELEQARREVYLQEEAEREEEQQQKSNRPGKNPGLSESRFSIFKGTEHYS